MDGGGELPREDKVEGEGEIVATVLDYRAMAAVPLKLKLGTMS